MFTKSAQLKSRTSQCLNFAYVFCYDEWRDCLNYGEKAEQYSVNNVNKKYTKKMTRRKI